MRKSEDVLRKIIGEAVNISLNEAAGDDPELVRMERIAAALKGSADKGLPFTSAIKALSADDFAFYQQNASDIKEIIATGAETIRAERERERAQSVVRSGIPQPVQIYRRGPEAAAEQPEELSAEELSATLQDIEDRKAAAASRTASDPEAVARAKAASELTLSPGTPSRERRVALAQPGPRARDIKVSMIPSIMSTASNADLDDDEVYNARRSLVAGMTEALKINPDPVGILHTVLYRDASTPDQVPKSVSSSLLISMIVTPPVLQELQTARAGTRMPTSLATPIPTADIATFASRLRDFGVRLSRSKDLTPEALAAELLRDLPVSVKRSIAMIANQVYKDGEKRDPSETGPAQRLLAVRLRIHADAVRPYMAQVEDQNRTIRRLTGGQMSQVDKTQTRVVDKLTGRAREVTALSPRRDRTIQGILVPRYLLGDLGQAEEDATVADDEESVFAQMGAAKFKRWQATAIYLIKRANFLLERRGKVESFYDRQLEELDGEIQQLQSDKSVRVGARREEVGSSQQLETEDDRELRERLEKKRGHAARAKRAVKVAFDLLEEAKRKHPYNKLLTVGGESAALKRLMGGAGVAAEPAATPLADGQLSFSDSMLGTLSKIVTKMPDDKLEEVRESLDNLGSAARRAGTVSRKDIEASYNWIVSSKVALKMTAGIAGSELTELTRALESSLENESAELMRVIAPDGSEIVGSSSEEAQAPEAEEEALLVEGNEEDNKRLHTAIHFMTSTEIPEEAVAFFGKRVEELSTVPIGTIPRDPRAAFPRRAVENVDNIPEMISRAIGKKKSDFMELLDKSTAPDKAKLDRITQEYKEASALGHDIIDRSRSNPKKSAALRVALRAAFDAAAGSPSIAKVIDLRVDTARGMRCEDTPSKIFLTPTNAAQGAIQLAIEARLGSATDAPTLDTLTPYAIPFGPNTGLATRDDLLSIAGTQKTKKEYIDKAISAAKPWYMQKLGSSARVGNEVVIPSMMRRQTGANKQTSRLSLGVGRVVSIDALKTPLTPDLISAQDPEVKQQITNLRGVEANVMGVTVSFPPSQWSLGVRQFFGSSDELPGGTPDEVQRKLSALKQQLEKKSLLQYYNVKRNRGAVSREDEALLEEAERLSSDLSRFTVIRKSDVIGALVGTDSTLLSSFLGTSISVSDEGVLTVSNIAPAFLDTPAAHNPEISLNRWSLSGGLFETDKASVISLEVRSTAAAPGVPTAYVPISAVQLKLEHTGDPASPFNINRSDAVEYTVGDQRTSLGVGKLRIDTQNLPQVRKEHVRRINEILAPQGAAADPTAPAPVATEYASKALSKDSFPIAIAFVGDENASQKIRSKVESDATFMEDYSLLQEVTIEGKTALIYEMRPSARTSLDKINRVGLAGPDRDVSVGDLVYIEPMYLITHQRGAANAAYPVELLGVGKVRSIYLIGPGGKRITAIRSDNPYEFRSLLADVEFRGDQVKKNGTRGSLRSPNLTLREVNVLFLRKMLDTPSVPISMMSPDRFVADISKNYPTLAQRAQGPIYDAGWHLPSPVDSEKQAKGQASVAPNAIVVGGNVKIVSENHPLNGSVAQLIGFLPTSQISDNQRSFLGDVSKTSLNAVVSVSGVSLMPKIGVIIKALVSEIMGKPFSSVAQRQLFKHIDRDITRRYLENPKSASGFLALKSERDQIGANSHGAGSWEKFHGEGHAVYPGSKSFAEKTGMAAPSRVEEIPSPAGVLTLYGCNAIYRAVLEHGPEKSITSEAVYEAEHNFFSGDDHTPYASTSASGEGSDEEKAEQAISNTLRLRTPYPPGLHTGEAVYIRHSHEGLRKGRTSLRVGSPVGTSFRFEINPEDGLEYTRMLRSALETVQNRVTQAVDAIQTAISDSTKAGLVDAVTMEDAKQIKKDLEQRVLGVITRSLDEIKQLGHGPDRKNTLTAWREVQAELAKLETTTSTDLSQGSRDQILQEIRNLWTQHTLSGVPEEILFGAAPIPTDYKISVSGSGEITILFSDPKPVYRDDNRRLWREAQLSAMKEATDLIIASVRAPEGQENDPKVKSAQMALEQMLSAMRSKLNAHQTGDAPLAWESDIVGHPSLSAVFSQGDVSRVIRNLAKSGMRITLPIKNDAGVQVTFVERRPDNAETFGNIKIAIEGDVIRSENEFFAKFKEFTESALTPAISRMNTRIRESNIPKQVADNLLAHLRTYLQVLRSHSGPDWRRSPFSHFAQDPYTPDLAARKSADLAHLMQSSINGILAIAERGVVRYRTAPEDAEKSARVDALRAQLEEISADNERSQLESMSGFPSDKGLKDVVSDLQALLDQTIDTRFDQVCVPVKLAPSVEDRMTQILLKAVNPGAKIDDPEILAELSGAIIPE